MINFKKLLLLMTMMSISFGSMAAHTTAPWSVIAGPITSTILAQGDTVSTVSATLRDGSNAILATGSISDFALDVGSIINGLFTSDAGTYTITGAITAIDFFNNTGTGFVFSGFTGDSNIDFGSISVTPGSSSLNLSGSSFVFTPVPIPAAVWLFGSALITLVGVRRSKASA